MITRRALLGHGLTWTAAAACLPDAPRAPVPRPKAPEPRPDLDPGQVPRPLLLGLMPVLEPEAMRARFAPFADHLGRALGTTVELRIAESYTAAIEAAVRGEVHVAQLSPVAFVAAKRDSPALFPLATNISEGSSMYSGYLVAQRRLRITRSRDLVGLRIGFVDERSASGYLYPYAFLLEQDIDPRSHMRPTLLGRHDRIIDALAADEIDVGATFSGALNYAELRGVDTRGLEIVAKTGRIPHDTWVANPRLPEGLLRTVQYVLLDLSTRTKEGRRVLEPIRSINAFAQFDEDLDLYKPVRQKLNEVERAKAAGS